MAFSSARRSAAAVRAYAALAGANGSTGIIAGGESAQSCSEGRSSQAPWMPVVASRADISLLASTDRAGARQVTKMIWIGARLDAWSPRVSSPRQKPNGTNASVPSGKWMKMAPPWALATARLSTMPLKREKMPMTA